MGKLVVTEFMTLDGVIEEPQLWSLSFWSDEAAAFKSKELERSSALLLGRVTYDGFAEAWPQRGGDPYSDKFNTMPKYVVSSGSPDLGWNNSHHVEGDLVEAVKRIKTDQEGDVAIHGSGTLARAMIAAGLVDQINLLIYPVVRGEGQKLFDEGLAVDLDCASAKRIANGVIVTTFAPKAG
ncbi:MAG: dihydrofolate reductase [Porphyrobacter sp.]|nr:dihydrofolate reductase [Porphyrobacter sp.]